MHCGFEPLIRRLWPLFFLHLNPRGATHWYRYYPHQRLVVHKPVLNCTCLHWRHTIQRSSVDRPAIALARLNLSRRGRGWWSWNGGRRLFSTILLPHIVLTRLLYHAEQIGVCGFVAIHIKGCCRPLGVLITHVPLRPPSLASARYHSSSQRLLLITVTLISHTFLSTDSINCHRKSRQIYIHSPTLFLKHPPTQSLLTRSIISYRIQEWCSHSCLVAFLFVNMTYSANIPLMNSTVYNSNVGIAVLATWDGMSEAERLAWSTNSKKAKKTQAQGYNPGNGHVQDASVNPTFSKMFSFNWTWTPSTSLLLHPFRIA